MLLVACAPPPTHTAHAPLTPCSLRGIQPVSRVSCPRDNLCGLTPWDCELPMGGKGGGGVPGEVTRALQQAVVALQLTTPVAALLTGAVMHVVTTTAHRVQESRPGD